MNVDVFLDAFDVVEELRTAYRSKLREDFERRDVERRLELTRKFNGGKL